VSAQDIRIFRRATLPRAAGCDSRLGALGLREIARGEVDEDIGVAMRPSVGPESGNPFDLNALQHDFP
jgi:hypothetical protein